MLSADKLNDAIRKIKMKLDALNEDELNQMDAHMAIDFDEHFQFQSIQAQYHALGVLSPEAAQIIYVALGEHHNRRNGGWATDCNTATKCAITKLMQELLGFKIQAMKATAV